MQVEILRVSAPIVYIFSPLAQMFNGRQALYEQVEVWLPQEDNSTVRGQLSLGALSSRL